MAFILAGGILLGGAWLALTFADWIDEGKKEGIVNTGYVGEEASDEGKVDL